MKEDSEDFCDTKDGLKDQISGINDPKIFYGPDGYPIREYSHPMKELSGLKGPTYKLRYKGAIVALEEKCEKTPLRSMIEYGSAELKLFELLSRSELLTFQEIYLADIKENKLKEFKHRVHPAREHYLQKRETPLNVTVCVASIGQPFSNLKAIDAVVAIEVIEHLYPNIFDAMEYNIFAFLQPKIVILTTPNSDFNAVFSNFKGVRDPDHKFEWSRKQFHDWSTNIVKRFPNYNVRFEGIGEGTEEQTKLYGCVSQMAIFEKINPLYVEYQEDQAFGICTCNALLRDKNVYKVIEKQSFPYTTREDVILMKTGDYIRSCMNENCEFFDEILEILSLPLKCLAKSLNSSKHIYQGEILNVSETELEDILVSKLFRLEKLERNGMITNCLIYSYNNLESDNESIESEDTNLEEPCIVEHVEEEW